MFPNLAMLNTGRLNQYEAHYGKYLRLIALQLIEWKNLPLGIDARFLEMCLHTQGHVAIGYDKNMKFFAATGTDYGLLDIYGLPTQFNCVFPNQTQIAPLQLYTYLDDVKENCNGVLIYNNDFRQPSFPELDMFAKDLAHVKSVQKINVNNQKTPFIFVGKDKQLLSLKKMQSEFDAHLDSIIIDEKLKDDPKNLGLYLTPAPYVADKLQEHFASLWSEVMTFLGIDANAYQKKERMLVDEVNANNEQNRVSENIYLKTRQEACDRMNHLWGLDIEVCVRAEAVDKLQQQLMKEGGIDEF